MENKTLTCIKCGAEFEFTAGEQEFYNEKGFQEPKKCKPCRDADKLARSNKKSSFGSNQSFNNNVRPFPKKQFNSYDDEKAA